MQLKSGTIKYHFFYCSKCFIFKLIPKFSVCPWSRKFSLLPHPFLFAWAQQEEGFMSSTKTVTCRGLIVPQRARHPQSAVLRSLELTIRRIFVWYFLFLRSIFAILLRQLHFSMFLWSSSYSNLEMYFSKVGGFFY